MESVILKVVLVLGIIIAGGFLLFFMADILMAIFNGKKDEKIINENEKKEVAKVEEDLANAGVKPEETAALLNGAVVENYDPEEGVEETPAEEVVENQEAAEEESDEEDEEEDEEEEVNDRDAYIEARRKALMERLAKMNEDDEEEDEEEETESEDEESDEEVEETEEVVDLDEASEEEEDNSSEELEEARRALEAERAKTEALKAELAARSVATETSEPVYLSEEEYEARLAVLNERLKLNEKELRSCKKEYLPLRRVKKTLENDEKKLRRKEALVAKQKVVLYGVNNYADIDEEKAKKLAEDLDLLDGLKLSVEHCQEVMNKNEERYPLLERIYTVLSEQNETIKADIARAEKELAEVRAKKGSDDAE